jgi:hypothetical protein
MLRQHLPDRSPLGDISRTTPIIIIVNLIARVCIGAVFKLRLLNKNSSRRTWTNSIVCVSYLVRSDSIGLINYFKVSEGPFEYF